MKSLTKTMITTGVILVALFFGPLIAYISNFRKGHISSSPDDWGTFGDYLGGFLNPILGILNILVLVYLTFKLPIKKRTELTA